jgi:hypothetical protein
MMLDLAKDRVPLAGRSQANDLLKSHGGDVTQNACRYLADVAGV